MERFHDGEHKIPRLEEERVDVSMLSKKRRLMMQWQEGQENQSRENGNQIGLDCAFVVKTEVTICLPLTTNATFRRTQSDRIISKQ